MIRKEDFITALSRRRPKTYGPGDFPGFTRAAVLVPLLPTRDGLAFLLTRRTESVETHKGQVSFPGGVQEHAGERPVETALRETEEELAIPARDVEILGLLDERPVPTQFIITPVVGFLQCQPVISLHQEEVAEVFIVPVSFLANDNNAKPEERDFQGRKATVWHFHYGRHHIWGATASIIKDLIGLVRAE